MIHAMQMKHLPATHRRRLIAKRRQHHSAFKKIEERLRLRCADTKGAVQYIPPPATEATHRGTSKRRQDMLNELIPHMHTQERQNISSKMQNHGNYKRAEEDLKHKCHQSSGLYKVKYEPPSETDLWSDTKARRKSLRQELIKYYRFQVMLVLIKEVSTNQNLTRAIELFSEKITVDCPLGAHNCPCRGVQNNHTFFSWRWTDEEFETKLKAFKPCFTCGNLYLPNEVETMDLLYRICILRMKINDQSPHESLICDKMLFARIKMWLIPTVEKKI